MLVNTGDRTIIQTMLNLCGLYEATPCQTEQCLTLNKTQYMAAIIIYNLFSPQKWLLVLEVINPLKPVFYFLVVWTESQHSEWSWGLFRLSREEHGDQLLISAQAWVMRTELCLEGLAQAVWKMLLFLDNIQNMSFILKNIENMPLWVFLIFLSFVVLGRTKPTMLQIVPFSKQLRKAKSCSTVWAPAEAPNLEPRKAWDLERFDRMSQQLAVDMTFKELQMQLNSPEMLSSDD